MEKLKRITLYGGHFLYHPHEIFVQTISLVKYKEMFKEMLLYLSLYFQSMMKYGIIDIR